MKENKKQYHYPTFIRDKQLVAGFYYHEILFMAGYFILLLIFLRLIGVIITLITLPGIAFLIHKKKEVRFTTLMESYLQVRYLFSEKIYLKNPRLEKEDIDEKKRKKS